MLPVAALLAATRMMAPVNAQPVDDVSVLPFSGGDRVTIVDERTGRARVLSGRVEDLTGSRLTLRSNRDGRTDVVRLPDVARIDFLKSAEFEQGLSLLQSGDNEAARRALSSALDDEQRPWVRREIRAVLARNAMRLRERRDAITQIQAVFADDADTRHLSLLPLVWDERLPAEQRLTTDAAWLNSDSPVEQLASASALLADTRHRSAAIRVLEDLKHHRNGSLSALADAQLWRLRLLEESTLKNADVNSWQRRIPMLPAELRPGPQYVLARALRLRHDYDGASRAFLWMPLMAPVDPDLTARSLTEAVECLRLAGRPEEAALLTTEGAP